MEDRETARTRKYGESKTTRIMMATVPHVTSGSRLRKFQADGFLLDRVYKYMVQVSSRDFIACFSDFSSVYPLFYSIFLSGRTHLGHN